MKQYLVTRIPTQFPSGETDVDDWQELPPGGKWLTRAQVGELARLRASTNPSNWTLYEQRMDEIFREKDATP